MGLLRKNLNGAYKDVKTIKPEGIPYSDEKMEQINDFTRGTVSKNTPIINDVSSGRVNDKAVPVYGDVNDNHSLGDGNVKIKGLSI